MEKKIPTKKEFEQEVLYTSLVGRKIEITDSKIKSQIGLKGIIIYESAKFIHLKLEKEAKIIKIFKNNIFFKTTIFGKALNIDARLLFSTVLPRIKKIK